VLAGSADAMRVLVTGAGGRTGKLVFEQLSANTATTPVGLVRSKKAAKQLRKAGAAPAQMFVGSTTDPAAVARAMAGCDAVVLCTSAVPQIKKWGMAKFAVKKLAQKVFKNIDAGRPSFKFAPGGAPEEVDWLGAKLQVDAAKAAGVKHFVFVSSMGGTQPTNFLNTLGRRPDGSGGDILLWKRKAERYLATSGLTYTIVHPGGLLDEAPGQRALTVGVNDDLLAQPSRSVPRADVARVCVAALLHPGAHNKSFDLASQAKEAPGATPTADAAAVFAALGSRTCSYGSVSAAQTPPSIPELR